MREPLTILVAEDDAEDAFLVERAFQKADMDVRIHYVRDGQEAMDYLSGAPPYSDRSTHPQPNVLLLDLKLPKVSGFEVLKWLRERQNYARPLVIIFSSSSDQKDVDRAYDLGASFYLPKPPDFEGFMGLLQRLRPYWFESNIFPETGGGEGKARPDDKSHA
jgi:CheY-like chemotaxis protein